MEILNQFGINPILLAAQVVNFLILLFILKKFMYKPLLKVLDQRKKTIEDSLKNAQEIERRLLQTEEDRDKILAKASQEAQKIADETKKELTLMREEDRQKAKDESEQIIKKAQEAARLESEKVLSEAKTEIIGLVMAVFQKVTGKVVTKEDQRKIIEKEIRNLS